MLRAILRNAGIHPRTISASVRGALRYAQDKSTFRSLSATHPMPWGQDLPMLTEWDDQAGSLGSYFYQDQTVARWIYEADPVRHVDVGSRIDGFIGHLSVFRPVDVIDIRPLPSLVRNVTFHQLDLMQPLPTEWEACTDSLSCLHTIEHFGLGRYGDPVDPDGHLKGLAQLKRMVKPGGTLYLSTPSGKERIEFNAHRIFSAKTILSWFQDGWTMERCAVLTKDSNLRLVNEAELLAITDDTCLPILAFRKVASPQ